MTEREFQVRYAKRDDHCIGVFTFYVKFVYIGKLRYRANRLTKTIRVNDDTIYIHLEQR